MNIVFRGSLLATTALIIATHAPAALAQEAQTPEAAAEQSAGPAKAEPESGAEPQEIVITGSRLARPDLTSSVPILVAGADMLDNRGIENFADLATQLPQFAPSYGQSRTQSTFSGTATSGLNLINLRNLGTVRTLTLLNGRRMAGGGPVNPSVDLNTVPTANVARIEVITGGASATYGADAVSGVVNIITDKSLRGLRVGASYGVSEKGDNKNSDLYVRFGSDLGDGGYVQLTGQYDYQGFVGCSSRWFCAEDFLWNPPAAPVRGPNAYSAVGAKGTFFLIGANGLPAINATRIGNSFTDASGNLIPFVTSRDGYNRNADRTLAIPTKRYLFAADAEYPINDLVSAFLEVNYGRSEIKGEFEAHPFQSSAAGSLFGGGPGVPGLQTSIPVDNPFIPQALRNAAIARGQSVIQWQQRMAGIGQRGATNDRETMRFATGLKGGFQISEGKDWNWEVSYVNGRTKLDAITEGLVSTRNLYYGLRVEADPANPGGYRCADAGARASGCVPINPFDGYDAAEAKALNVTAGVKGKSQLQDILAYASGDLIELPGGNLGLAFGAEYRSFGGFLDYSDVINNAQVTGNQIADVNKVTTKTQELFIEGIAPVLGDMPFVRRLTIEGAFRRSDPNRGDSYSTWRYGGTYEPIKDLKLRVMRARSVREPVPGELGGLGQTFGTVIDPCAAALRNANPTRAANCLAAGVPANYAPPQSAQQSVGGFVGGNPDLQPEKATTLTFGAVVQPSFVPGLSLTVDRFKIKLKDLINTIGRQAKANACYDSGLFCGDVVRGTNPNVPGATWVLVSVNDQLTNVAALDVRGVDISVRYDTRLLDGKLSLTGLGTLYDKAKSRPLPGASSVDLLGFAGGSTSDQGFVKFTGNANVNWQGLGGLSLNYNLRYIGKAKTSPFAPDTYPTIGDRFYHNARVGYEFAKKYEIYAGVDNILDSDPPMFPTSTAGTQALDTVPALYDVFGRSYYAGVKLKF